MTRLPRLTARQLVRALKRAGWYEDDQEGAHLMLRHLTKPGKVTLPIHRGKIIGPALLRSILSQAGLTVEEFRRLL